MTGVLLAVTGSFASSIVVKVTLTTALALGAVRLMPRRRASERHVLLAAAFALLLVLPLLAFVVPPVQVGVSVADVQDGELRPVASFGSTAALAASAMMTAIFLAPMFVGVSRLWTLRRSAIPWARSRSAIESLAGNPRVPRRVEVLLHGAAPGPMTCGLLRPAIVLPLDAVEWAEADLRRALVHELEHVHRRDQLWQCTARFVCACYWFHPLVWMARRQLALEAERACDDAVLAGGESVEYADQLVRLATQLTARSQALAMASREDLGRRVQAVLDSGQARGRAGAVAIALASVVSGMLVGSLAPVRVVAVAPAAASSLIGRSLVAIQLQDVPPGVRAQLHLPIAIGGRFTRGTEAAVLAATRHADERLVADVVPLSSQTAAIFIAAPHP